MAKREPIVRADTRNGQIAGEALIEAVGNQIRENRPPETKRTLKRLMSMGQTRENAMRYIACALSQEVFEALTNHTPYDEARYIRNLKALPKLPDELDNEI